MGCGSSSAVPEEPEDQQPPSCYENAEAVSSSLFQLSHDRLRRLRELDASTKVPFILVELTGEADGQGEIEICGKDEYGIYEALDDYFQGEWNCEVMDAGDDTEDTKIPFCAAQYRWPGFRMAGDEGMSNMGLMTMRLIDFVCSKESWTLACINGGNVGKLGEVREMQIVFKAPHPMNLVAPHLMIELRSAGYVEVCADIDEKEKGVLDIVDEFMQSRFKAEKIDGHEDYCDLYYKAGEDVFKGMGDSLDNNFGMLVTDVCDKVASIPGWSLVACSGGNYGETSEHSEEQLVFRRDEHPLGDAKYVMVVMNEKGNMEVYGKPQRGLYDSLHQVLTREFGAKKIKSSQEEGTNSRRYGYEGEIPEKAQNMFGENKKAGGLMLASNKIIKFFEKKGWEMQVCSQALVKEEGAFTREQQLFFRPGKTEVGTIEPHLLVELYSGEGSPELYQDPEEPTQVLANQHIRVMAIAPTERQNPDAAAVAAKASEEIGKFVMNYLGGTKEETDVPGIDNYRCNIFFCRGMYENNMAQWTMRACDFIVDRLGWSFIACTLCNMGEYGQYRAQQIAFRYDGDIRAVPVAKRFESTRSLAYDSFEGLEKPEYWISEIPMEAGDKAQVVQCCSQEEIDALQVMVDTTYRRVLTRDRQPDEDAIGDEEMPFRLEVINAFRSENASLHLKITQREAVPPVSPRPPSVELQVKTGSEPTLLHERLGPGEAYLFHGTNPSSGMNILASGFDTRHAGTSTGKMFGAGVYTAECSSKADEYAHDDGGGTYPGLRAMLVCKCYVGVPLIVDRSGDHTTTAKEHGYDTVIGDRETAVGTYREFVFLEDSQIYPEYTVIYRRVYEKEKVPDHMVTPTTGTTGRFWQVRAPRDQGGAWKNLPAEVNKILVQALERGLIEVNLEFGGKDYTFNLEQKSAINNTTGAKSPLRAPMR